jgi:hypothetical protein
VATFDYVLTRVQQRLQQKSTDLKKPVFQEEMICHTVGSKSTEVTIE